MRDTSGHPRRGDCDGVDEPSREGERVTAGTGRLVRAATVSGCVGVTFTVGKRATRRDMLSFFI